MVAAAQALVLAQIPRPFVGDWDIAQIFQATANIANNSYNFFGSYDRIQQHYIIDDGNAYYAIDAAATLGQLLNHLFPGNNWRVIEVLGAPDNLIASTIEQLDGASFDVEAIPHD